MPIELWPCEQRGDWLFPVTDYGYEVTLPDELVLRELLDLDLADAMAVVEFVNSYGSFPSELDARLPTRAGAVPQRRPPGDATNHIETVVDFLAVARALTRHWIADLAGDPVASAWSDEGIDISGPMAAWQAATACLSVGLEPYHPRVEVEYDSPVERSASGRPVQRWVLGLPQAHLFNGLTLQVFNLIVENLPPRKCGNEACVHWFVRQQGRAAHEQHRTRGVKYCSPSCANAQMQREHRRRKTRGGR